MDLGINKLKRINVFLERFEIGKKSLVYILFIMCVAAVCEALSAGLIIPFLNTFQNSQATQPVDNRTIQFLSQLFDGFNKEERFVYILMSILTLMMVVQFLIIYINRLLMKFAMFSIQNNISRRLYEEILHARLKFFYKQSSGNLINHLREDVNRCYNCIYHLLKMVAPMLIIFGFLTMSFLIVPMYTLWFIVGMALVGASFKFLLPYLYSLGVKNRESYQDANNVIVETLQGIRTVILSSAQENIRRKFNDIIYRYYHTIYKSSWITVSIPTAVKFVALIMVTGIVWVNKAKILSADPETISTLFFFIYVSGMIFVNAGKIHALHASFAFGYEGVEALLCLDDELRASKMIKPIGNTPFPEFRGEISVRNLGFEYLSNVPILNDLNFNISKNSRVAFAGSSGSGKSTLVDIISGFHDDYTGSILVDGVELREVDKADWRNLFGYVSQETFIFNDSVRNNLKFGLDREITDAELIDVCKKAQIYDTILSFKNQFETELGERGVRLSGGEKQRLAIAKLFLKNPPIVILDEATSSLDSASEKKVKDALDLLGQGRTVIAVAHRLSTIADFDYIYVLEKGHIAESGSHQELINQKGYYYRYFSIQSMEGSYV